jgi:hypothetical protein
VIFVPDKFARNPKSGMPQAPDSWIAYSMFTYLAGLVTLTFLFLGIFVSYYDENLAAGLRFFVSAIIPLAITGTRHILLKRRMFLLVVAEQKFKSQVSAAIKDF